MNRNMKGDIRMKTTLDNFQNLGRGIQEEYNRLIEILDQNIVERKLKVGTFEILTNLPIENLDSFKELISSTIKVGCSIGILKNEQLLTQNKITLIESRIGCYKCILGNLKTIRLHLYARREDVSKNIHITGDLRFDKDQAEQYVTRYIHALYTRIAELRKELWNIREGETIDFDESVFERDALLIKEDEPTPQVISKIENEKQQ